MAFRPERLSGFFGEQRAPDEWTITIIDHNGAVIGSSHALDQFIGKSAPPDLKAAIDAASEGSVILSGKDGPEVCYPCKRARGPTDCETAQVDRGEIRSNRQARTGGSAEGEILDEFVRARLVDRLAFLDLDRSFFSEILCSYQPGRERYCPKGERNWENDAAVFMKSALRAPLERAFELHIFGAFEAKFELCRRVNTFFDGFLT